jgi:hypothetical protein
MVGVAQQVEHQVVVLGVAGSSPVAHPIESAGQEALAGNGRGLPAIRCPFLGAIWEPILVAEGLNVEEAAYHESGHAVARWALDSPFLHITLNGPRGPIVNPLPGRTVSSRQHMLVAACGAIADYQQRGLVIRGSQITKLLLGGPNDAFELDDAVTHQVVVRPLRAPAVVPGGDLEYMARKASTERWPSAQYIGMWRDCERFVAGCRPAIDAVAAAVLDRGILSYDEVSEVATAAMVWYPAPVIPEWASVPVPRPVR